MVTSDDLGGLGAREGPPVAYSWMAQSLMPQLLPWLLALGLLALKRNRTPRAWWIWLPLGCSVALVSFVPMLFDFLPSDPLNLFSETAGALVFGVAGVWLVSPYLAGKHRALTFLGMLFTLVVISLVAFAIRLDWGDQWPQNFAYLVFLVVVGAVLAVALSLAGLACRRRYRPLWLTVWLTLWLAIIWTVIIASLVLFVTMMGAQGEIPWGGIAQAILIIAGASLVVTLPFLIFSFAHPFFRERLKELLRMGEASAPSVTAPPQSMPADTDAGQQENLRK